MARAAANDVKTQVRIAVDPSQVPYFDEDFGRWTAIGQVHPRHCFLVDGATKKKCLSKLLTRVVNPFGFSAVQPAAIWVQEGFVQGYDMDPVPWCASTRMPFELSRTWLKVERLALAQLCDITDEEIKAEGVVPQGAETLTEAFIRHWDAKARFDQQWKRNPLVWVATVRLRARPVSLTPAQEIVAE